MLTHPLQGAGALLPRELRAEGQLHRGGGAGGERGADPTHHGGSLRHRQGGGRFIPSGQMEPTITGQGTFREHSGNIQGTFREHSGNIHHSVNIQ